MKTKNFLIMLLLALMMPALAMAQNCTITVSQDGGYTAPTSTVYYSRGGGSSAYIHSNPQTITCNQGESFSLTIPCSGDYAPTRLTISYGDETQVVTLTPRLDQSSVTAFTVPSTSTASVTIHWTPIVAKNVTLGDFTYSLLYYDSSISPSRQAIVKSYNGTLTSFHTSETITYSGNTYTVVSVEQNAFKNNTSISVLRLPSTIIDIPSTMMQGCTNLQRCVIDGPITSIPFKAFDGCTSLHSSTTSSSNLFTVPATVTTIGGEAFMNCTSLKTVAIYTPVRAIAGSAFNGCSDDLLIRFQPSGSNTTLGTGSKLFSDYCGVHKMEVMSGITAIGDQTFAGCNAMTNFTMTSDVQTLGSNVFNGSVQDLSVTINKGSRAGQINSYLFQNVSNVKSLTIGSGITQILSYAFKNCTNLTTVSLPSTLTTIAFQAFYGCPNITNLVIPSSVKNIYNQAFYDYTGPVNIPSSVTAIELGAFFNATNVTVNWETPLTLSSNPFSSALQANATLHVPTGTVDAYRAANYWKNFGTITDGTTTSTLDYAVLSTDGKTLTFYHDSNQANREGTVYSLNTGSVNPGWYGQKDSVESVVFNSTFASARPTTTYRWFSGMSNLTSITGLSYLNTSEVTNMEYMFFRCSKLTSLNLNLSGFNTSKVTSMRFIFGECSGLTSLNVAGFNTANVTDMTAMFQGCSALTALDLSSFNTAKVIKMAQMFSGCSKLTSLDLSSFNTANVREMSYMFYTCYALTSLDISSFRTPEVTSMGYMFYNCRALTSLDVSKFSTVNVTTMIQMFTSCWNLTDLDVSSFTTVKVTNMSAMFSDCQNLISIDVSGFITENVTKMKEMFSNCTSVKRLDLHKWDTSSVTDMTSMFSNASELTTIYAGDGWTTANVTASNNMFSDCTKLVGGAGTAYNSNATDATYARIDGGTSTPGYFTSAQNIIFADANVKSVCIANWDTNDDGELSPMEASVVTAEQFGTTFRNNTSITTFNELQYFTGLTSISSSAFNGCTNLVSITLPSTITAINPSAFNRCTSLTAVNIPEGVTAIGSLAFGTCKQLADVKLPNGLVTLGQGAFFGTQALTHIEIPQTVTSMNGAFDYYSQESTYNLTSVKVNWTTPISITENTFPQRSQATLYVPIGTEETYRAAPYWQDFGNIVPSGNIEFADANVKNICVTSWDTDGDGELSTLEAASVTNLQGWAKQDIIPGNTYFIRNVGTGLFLTGGNLWNMQISLSEDQTPYVQIRVESLPDADQAAYPNCYMLRLDGSYTFDSSTRTDTYLFRSDAGDGSMGFLDAMSPYVCKYFRIVKNANGHYTIQSAPGFANLNTSGSEYAGGDGPGAPVYFNLSETSPNIEWDFVSTSPIGFNGTNITSFNELQYFTGLTEIPESAFTNCHNLASIKLPSTITAIGNWAFQQCEALTEIEIPASVKSIGMLVFPRCTNLAVMQLHEGLETIGAGSLSDTALDSFTIPSTVTNIDDVFYNSFYVLEGIHPRVVTAPWAEPISITENTFPNRHNATLFVPQGKEDVYRAAPFWQDFGNIVGHIIFEDPTVKALCIEHFDTNGDGELSTAEAAAVTSFGSYYDDPNSLVFAANSDIQYFNELQYFTGLQDIEAFAFAYCENLASVTLPSNIKTIGNQAFHNTNLHSIEIPEGVTTIYGAAFYDCKQLTNVILPSTLIRISTNAFNGCSNLRFITIPESVTEFGNYAFNNCTALTQVRVKWDTPLEIGDADPFPNRADITLIVPPHTGDAYRNAPYWQDFFQVREDEPYAHVSPDGTTLTFYFDDLKATRDGHVYPLNEDYDLPQWTSNAWNNSIQTAVFDSSFANARPTTTAKWFVNMEILTTITGLENLNTSEVTNMQQMFGSCHKLTSLDLSGFNTEKVQTMYGMFANCKQLTSLDLSSFNTAKVNFTYQMFYGCPMLQTIYVGNGWTTAAVDKTNLNNYCDMFTGDEMLEGGAGTRYMDDGWSTEWNVDIEYARVDAPGAPGYFTFKGTFIRGDVNGDNKVTIADVTALVNVILGKSTTPASGVADVNGDNKVTIADVTALVNIILGK